MNITQSGSQLNPPQCTTALTALQGKLGGSHSRDRAGDGFSALSVTWRLLPSHTCEALGGWDEAGAF